MWCSVLRRSAVTAQATGVRCAKRMIARPVRPAMHRPRVVVVRSFSVLGSVRRASVTAPVRSALSGGSGIGNVSSSVNELPFFDEAMSDADRERIKRAISLFDAANRFAEKGNAEARAEAVKLLTEVVSIDSKGALGFRALLALAALNQRLNPARVIDYTVTALNLILTASADTKRHMLQLKASAGAGAASTADTAQLDAAVSDFVWGLRLNIGFQAIDWMVTKQIRDTAQLGFLLVLLREHMAPAHIYSSTRTDDDAVQLIVRARKALLALSEYLKVMKMYSDAESFAKAALESLDGMAHESWVAEGYFQIAAIRTQSGATHEQVLPWAQKALSANPKHWKAHALIGEITLFGGDFDTAIHHLDQALGSTEAIPVEFKGSTHYSMGNALFHKAMNLERTIGLAAAGATAQTPTLDPATLSSKRSEFESLLDDSITQYQKALTEPLRSRLHPNILNSLQSNLGAALMKRARITEAMDVLKTSAKGSADAVSLPRLNLVFAMLAQGPFSHAEKELGPFIGVTRVPTGEVDDVDNKLTEAIITEGSKRLNTAPAQAIEYFHGAIKVMDATKTETVVRRWRPGAEARLGLAHARLNQFGEAVSHLERAASLLEEYKSSASIGATALSIPASPLLDTSNTAADASGASLMGRATLGGASGGVDLYCTPVSVQLALAQTHHMNKSFAKAMHHYQTALNCVPAPTIDDQMTTLYNMGSLQMMANRFGEAEGYLRQADTLKPNQPMVINMMSQAALMLNKPDDALALVGRVQEIDPNFIDQYVNLANIQLRRNDLHSSLAAAQKSLQMDPNFQTSRVHFTIGLAFLGLGKLTEGRAHLELAQSTDPSLKSTIQQLLSALPEEAETKPLLTSDDEIKSHLATAAPDSAAAAAAPDTESDSSEPTAGAAPLPVADPLTPSPEKK